MSKKYFKNFDFIKEVQNAKSLSYISSDKNTSFSHKLYLEFENILKNHEDRFRVSLHNNSGDDLHNMIIGMKKDSFVYPHKHKKSESYQIVFGRIALIYFTDLGKVSKTVMLSPKDYLIARVDKEVYHALICLSDSIYHETRVGPFVSKDDSLFATWVDEDKDIYMQRVKNENC